MVGREAEPFDADGFADPGGIDATVVQNDDPAEGMANEANGKIVDDVEKRGEIENVFGDGVDGAGSPGGVAVAAKVEGIDMVITAKILRDPVPHAGMV